MRELLRSLISQDRALANARRASTELSRWRVVRDEVEIFLEQRLRSTGRPDGRPDGRPAEPAVEHGSGHAGDGARSATPLVAGS